MSVDCDNAAIKMGGLTQRKRAITLPVFTKYSNTSTDSAPALSHHPIRALSPLRLTWAHTLAVKQITGRQSWVNLD